MLVKALHVSKKILLRELQAKFNFQTSMKEPFLIEYSSGKYVTIFRFGVLVFWGFSQGEINEFLAKIEPFVTGRLETTIEEDLKVEIGGDYEGVRGNEVFLKVVSPSKVALISVILGRTIALDYFEREVEQILSEFGSVVQSFASEGRSKLSTRNMLRRVGQAMSIQHRTVNQMTLLDKPDLTWDEPGLDQFYHELNEEYEIEDRHAILSDKLKTLFGNVEFILQVVESRRSLLLELTIVALITVEIGLFLYELFGLAA